MSITYLLMAWVGISVVLWALATWNYVHSGNEGWEIDSSEHKAIGILLVFPMLAAMIPIAIPFICVGTGATFVWDVLLIISKKKGTGTDRMFNWREP